MNTQFKEERDGGKQGPEESRGGGKKKAREGDKRKQGRVAKESKGVKGEWGLKKALGPQKKARG